MQLFEKGFKNLDALDASAKMLEKAKQTGYYQQFYEDFMGKNRLDIPDGIVLFNINVSSPFLYPN